MVSPLTGEKFGSSDKLFISDLHQKCVLGFFVAAVEGEYYRALAAVNATHPAL